MFMIRARAYSSSCLQVVLIYVHPFYRNSLFCSRKSQNKIIKALILGMTGFKLIQGHRC